MRTQNSAATDNRADLGSIIETTYARSSADTRVAVVDGYGISVSVEHGHLVLRDGLGKHQRTRTYPRIERKLRRIVVLARDGSITLAAMRWCADLGIALVTIDPETCTVLATSGTVHDDARLRRAQALAPINGVGLEIARYLLMQKIQGHTEILRTHFGDAGALARIEGLATQLRWAGTVEGCRGLEGAAAAAYFSAWAGLATGFPERDLARMPHHWRAFDRRLSSLNNFRVARAAATPINALLNYAYAIAEAECRIACQALGLDPGLGILHVDRANRDSFALDLLEAIRPDVDRHVLRMVFERTLRASDFHETRTGQCRILAPLTHHLAEACYSWRRAVAPVAERVAHLVADHTERAISRRTPLTQANHVRARERIATTSEEPMRSATTEPESEVGASNTVASARCGKCGSVNIHLNDDLCSWCVTSRNSRAAWKARRADTEGRTLGDA